MKGFSQEEKILGILKELRGIINIPTRVSLTKFFQDRGVAGEYGKYAKENGLIIKLKGGESGPSVYQFNRKIKLDLDIVGKMVERYNHSRNDKIFKIKKSNEVGIMNELSEIKSMLSQLLERTGTINI